MVVLRQLPQSAHNALWHLFSAVPEQVDYAVRAYHQRSQETSSLLDRLFEGYKKEGLPMPYTMADFRREYVKEHLKDLTPEERLEGSIAAALWAVKEGARGLRVHDVGATRRALRVWEGIDPC